MNLRILTVITFSLFLVSLGVYSVETRRGTELIQGSDFIKGLDVGTIQKIVISKGKDQSVSLTRDSGTFVLDSHKSYPADVAKINDLIYRISSIQVREKVSSDLDDLKKYHLDGEKISYKVDIYDNSGSKALTFRVGKNHKGIGNYIYKEGGDSIYLSDKTVWLSATYKELIDRMLVEFDKDSVEKLEVVEKGRVVELARGEKGFEPVQPVDAKIESKKVEEFLGKVNGLRFDEYYSPSDQEVSQLSFRKSVSVELKNKLRYNVHVAKKDKEHFVKVDAFAGEVPRRIEVTQEDGKDKLIAIEDMVRAQGTAQKFNMLKGRWVFKVDESTYKKIVDTQF